MAKNDVVQQEQQEQQQVTRGKGNKAAHPGVVLDRLRNPADDWPRVEDGLPARDDSPAFTAGPHQPCPPKKHTHTHEAVDGIG